MNIIETYLRQIEIPERMIQEKLKAFQKHNDIADEFIFWIKNNAYKENGIIVDGYSAKSIASKSYLLNGLSSFTFLIQLRENPNKAKMILQSKITIK